jgi:hypothetical protein
MRHQWYVVKITLVASVMVADEDNFDAGVGLSVGIDLEFCMIPASPFYSKIH